MRSNCIPAPRRMGNRHTLERLYHTSLVDQVENATRLSGLSHLILEPVIGTIGGVLEHWLYLAAPTDRF